VLRSSPEMAAARRRLLEAGAHVARMSGSGPTLFAPFRTLAGAAEAARRVADDSLMTWLTHTVGRDEVAKAQRLAARRES
jgi:4-diphosphocytidyl-2C-methyl-D-erythritol kinase